MAVTEVAPAKQEFQSMAHLAGPPQPGPWKIRRAKDL